MATKLKDIAVKVGEYQNANGETKARYMNIGAIMKSDDGNEFLLLDVLALNPMLASMHMSATKRRESSVLASLFDVRERKEKPAATPDDDEDKGPF